MSDELLVKLKVFIEKYSFIDINLIDGSYIEFIQNIISNSNFNILSNFDDHFINKLLVSILVIRNNNYNLKSLCKYNEDKLINLSKIKLNFNSNYIHDKLICPCGREFNDGDSNYRLSNHKRICDYYHELINTSVCYRPFDRDNLVLVNGKSIIHSKSNYTRVMNGNHNFCSEVVVDGVKYDNLATYRSSVGSHPWQSDNLKRTDDGKSIVHLINYYNRIENGVPLLNNGFGYKIHTDLFSHSLKSFNELVAILYLIYIKNYDPNKFEYERIIVMKDGSIKKPDFIYDNKIYFEVHDDNLLEDKIELGNYLKETYNIRFIYIPTSVVRYKWSKLLNPIINTDELLSKIRSKYENNEYIYYSILNKKFSD